MILWILLLICVELSRQQTDEGDLRPIYVTALPGETSCDNAAICRWMGKFRDPYAVEDYEKRVQTRSYHPGYGAPAPTYIPTFDPISILASLAFMAFLLQTLSTIFDRSRSFFPTVISSRKSSDSKQEELTKRVLKALNKYENLNSNSIVRIPNGLIEHRTNKKR